MSKKFEVKLEIDNSEVLDKEISELIKGRVREVCRNDFSKVISEVASEELKRIFKNDLGNNFTNLNKFIKETIQKEIEVQLKEVLKSIDLNKEVKDSLDLKISNIYTFNEEKIINKIESDISEKVNSEILKKLKEAFNL